MKNMSIGFIGGGRITKIFLHGFKRKNLSLKNISVFDPNKEALTNLKNTFPDIKTDNENIKTSAECDIIFLAVHPPLIIESLIKIKPFLKKEAILLSLAPKITIEKIKNSLNGFTAIARINPSAPGIINQGINPIAFSNEMNEAQKKSVCDLMQNLGKVHIVDESKIEVYAIIGAMGSTYFWFQLNKLKELGIKFGMNEKEAKEVISEMMKGTIDTLFYSNLNPDEVMDLVPVKPIGEHENTIKSFYDEKLNSLFEKIKP